MFNNYAKYLERYDIDYEYEFNLWCKRTGGNKDSEFSDCEFASWSYIEEATLCERGGWCCLEGDDGKPDLPPYENCLYFKVAT